jgi:hypothetical protein
MCKNQDLKTGKVIQYVPHQKCPIRNIKAGNKIIQD